nr:MAG TPA: hypothetical protein [Caudoviricetes sp.]
MNKYIQEALLDYDSAKRELEKFTKENTDFELSLDDGGYPLTFTFTPSVDSAQESMFTPDENGAVGSMRVICSSAGAGVDLGLKCHIQAEVLKKLLSRCQVCAEASLHAFKAGRCGSNE